MAFQLMGLALVIWFFMIIGAFALAVFLIKLFFGKKKYGIVKKRAKNLFK